MAQPRRGRPPNPVDPNASHAARLGAELRARRTAKGLTLQALGDLAGGYAPQYVSEVERAKTAATPAFIAAVDHALNARGELEALLPAAMREHEEQHRERAERRRTARIQPALRCEADSDAGEDVEPTNRRGLIGAGAAAAIGLSAAAAPAAAREIDPELPDHSARLLNLLGRHDAMFGPRDVLEFVEHELGRIAEHREVARGELRAKLMRVEARWAGLAAWLSEDAGQTRSRDAYTDRTLRLASEAGYGDMVAYLRTLQGRFALQERDAKRAIAFAEAGLHVPGTSQQTRALCARQAALGHALGRDATACERRLQEAHALLDADSSPPPWASAAVTRRHVRAAEAQCWLWLQPRKAIPLYENVLSAWPRNRIRDGGLHQARLALACAAAGERDRAEAEGRKALAIARATNSASAKRELRRLGRALDAET
jgi:transcriptional regulator with XRE-family HTH domain